MTESNQHDESATGVETSGGMNNTNMSIGFKHTGKNVYTTWTFAMTTMLTAYGLADYIDKSKAAVVTDPVKRAKTMLVITRNVDLSQLTLIKSFANDPAGAWAAL